jgi:hypothetical protein
MTTTAVTLEELESERADLLPSRETLCCPCYHPCGITVVVVLKVCF